MPAIAFIGGAYLSRARRLNAQECINLYPELDTSGAGKNVAMLVGCPGLSLFATVPGLGGMRALYTTSTGRLVAVRGSGVYEVTAGGGVTLLGSLLTTTGVVSLADNGIQLVLVDGPYGYVYPLAGGAVSQITDPNFFGSPVVKFLDGYFVFIRPGTGQVYLSPLYATSPLDALDFQTAEGSPDPLLTLATFRREVRLFGTQSTENWYNAGSADFPLSRNPAGYSELGICAPGSVAIDAQRVYWLGKDPRGECVVYAASAYEGERISTHAIEFALGQYASVDDAVGWCYQQEGHQFYVLTFPTGNATWVFDATTGLWHRRAWWNLTTGRYDRHRAQCHTYVFGRHLVGDWENGAVYQWRLDIYTDNGNPLRVLRSAPHISAPDLYTVAYHRFTLDAEVGVGLDGGTVPGSDPTVHLRWSNDGGATWADYRARSLGKLGAMSQRVTWHRLGQGRDRVFEVSTSMPVAQRWVNAHVLATQGVA